MSTNCFVKVLNVDEKTYATGVYKQVSMLQETGYWLEIFKVNVFPNYPIYENLQKGLRLSMEVKEYSKRYRTLVSATETLFKQCGQCKRYHNEETCVCPRETAIRIQGEFQKCTKCVNCNQLIRLFKSSFVNTRKHFL